MTTRYFDEFPPYASANRQLLRITRVHRPTAKTFPCLENDSALRLPDGEEQGAVTPRTADGGQLGSGTIMSVAMQGGGIDSISCYHPSVGVAECRTCGTAHSRFQAHIPLFFPKVTKRNEKHPTSERPSKWQLQSAFADSPFGVLLPSLGVRFRSDQADTYHGSGKDQSSIPPSPPASDDAYVDEGNLPSATPLMLGSTTFGELELEGWIGNRSIYPSFSPKRERTPGQESSPTSPSSTVQHGRRENERKVFGLRVGPLGVRLVQLSELDPTKGSSFSGSLLSGSENSASLSALQKQVTTSLETGLGFWIGKYHRDATAAKNEIIVAQKDEGGCGTTRGGYRVQCGLQYPLRGIADTLLSVTIESSLFRFFVIQTLASSYMQTELHEQRSASHSMEESSFSSPSLLQRALMTAQGKLPTLGCVGVTVIPHVLQLHLASMWQDRKMEEFEFSAAIRVSPFLRALGETVVRIGTNTQRHLAVGITTSIRKGIQLTLGMHQESFARDQGIKFGLHLQC